MGYIRMLLDPCMKMGLRFTGRKWDIAKDGGKVLPEWTGQKHGGIGKARMPPGSVCIEIQQISLTTAYLIRQQG